MKTQAVVVFAALLLLATLAAESDAFTGNVPLGKRELGEKVRKHYSLVFLTVCLVFFIYVDGLSY